MFSFNLVDKEWIPCIMPDGRRMDMSLRDTLVKALDIKEILDPSPLITATLHRFLLAILHRNFGPANEKKWQKLWGAGKWDETKLLTYLDKWRDRFDLFSEKYPFYQCASLPFTITDSKGKPKIYEKPIAKLTHELASGDNATLFDHTFEDNPKAVSPADAARLLIAFQAFAIGGLITRQEGEVPSADNAPMVKGAVVLVKGGNLFQTLMLNLHKYNRDDEEPFAIDTDDAPFWERDKEIHTEDRRPKGYLDLLTWQSRRIKLRPEQGENGQIVVKQVVIMKGNQFPDGFTLHQKEPMLAFNKVKRPGKNQDPWPPVAFQEDWALWRDSLTLFQHIKKRDERTRPKTLEWLHDLCASGIIPESSTYDLSLMGLVTSKAKISLWRHERLPLPLAYLEDEALIARLKDALDLAESAGTALQSSAWNLARLTIAPNAEKLNDNQKKDANNLSDHLAITRPYWAQLGISFNYLLTNLAQDRVEIDGEVIYGQNSLPWWAGEVRRAAQLAFREATDSLDRSGRMLKAVTLAEHNFNLWLNTRLKEFLRPYQNSEKKGGEA